MTTPISEFSKTLLETIKSKDAVASLALVKEYKSRLPTSAEYIVWITEPVNLTAVHAAITSNFDIPQKALMIKARPGLTRGSRANFFLQAMENSLSRAVK